ncbi:MAG: serine/threonine protein kinase, partial [Deltaproteobacteria bacterium]
MATTESEAMEGQPFGRYILERRIALGGMAEIFLARQEGPRGFSRRLVIKRILPHLADDPGFQAMFLDEARLAARLSHPNIVPIFDFGEVDGSFYLAMELVRGPDLRRLYNGAAVSRFPLSFAMTAKICAGVAEGLHYAHTLADEDGSPLHIVHRDISPSNVIVSIDGVPRILDFGIAKAASRSYKTQSGTIKGKFAYMPPEQIQGHAVDGRADLYALGVVLYQLVTGRTPFLGETDFDLMRAIVDEDPPPPRRFNADIPEALEAIILCALEKSPGDRFASGREMAAELERFVLAHGGPVSTFDIAEALARIAAVVPDLHGPVGTNPGHPARVAAGQAPSGQAAPGAGAGAGEAAALPEGATALLDAKTRVVGAEARPAPSPEAGSSEAGGAAARSAPAPDLEAAPRQGRPLPTGGADPSAETAAPEAGEGPGTASAGLRGGGSPEGAAASGPDREAASARAARRPPPAAAGTPGGGDAGEEGVARLRGRTTLWLG